MAQPQQGYDDQHHYAQGGQTDSYYQDEYGAQQGQYNQQGDGYYDEQYVPASRAPLRNRSDNASREYYNANPQGGNQAGYPDNQYYNNNNNNGGNNNNQGESFRIIINIYH